MSSKVRMGLCTAALGASIGYALAIWCTQDALPGDRLSLGLAGAIVGGIIAAALYALGASLADPAQRKAMKEQFVALGTDQYKMSDASRFILVAVVVGAVVLGCVLFPGQERVQSKDSFEAQWAVDQALAPVRDIYSHRVYGRPYAELDEGHRFVVEYMRAYDQSPASK